ncbi:hypothetical protein AKG43_05050 [Neisseria sp. 74A18]|nr:hypothetical protein AKG43_05050 [Neisseria sp. 74A18]
MITILIIKITRRTSMIELDFRNYTYYPILHTRSSEQGAFLNLSQDCQEKIIPSFVLHNRKGTKLTTVLDSILDTYNQNYILHLPSSPTVINKINSDDKLLFNHNSHFKNWIDLVSSYENAIPAVQISGYSVPRDVIKQAIILEQRKGKIAFRVKNQDDFEITISAVSALDSINNALIFLDQGYINNLTESYENSYSLMEKLNNKLDNPMVCLLSSSFPQSPAVTMKEIPEWCNHEIKGGIVQQKEKDLYLKLAEDFDILFGDYAAIYPSPFDTATEGRWSARIDFCTFDEYWAVFRMPKTHGNGYAPLAKHIVNLDIINNIIDCWGKDKILEASSDPNSIHGRSPAKWVEVRANTHMTHQISQTFFDDVDDEAL